MSDTSRRNFLAAAGVGAAAVGTVGITTGTSEAVASRKAAKQPVLALIDDHTSDVVRLLVGEREIVVRDKDLATRILNAAGGK